MMRFAPECFWRLLFWGFFLGGPFAKPQKMLDLDVFAKFVIARLYGHFWSRGLQQIVVLWFHFKWILIRRWCGLRQGVFIAYFFEEIPLVTPFQNLRPECPCQICHSSALRALLELRFAASQVKSSQVKFQVKSSFKSSQVKFIIKSTKFYKNNANPQIAEANLGG